MSTQALSAVAESATVAPDQASSRVASTRPRESVGKSAASDSIEQLKRLYSTDQQAEYLFIRAEADSLLVKLEQSKSQKR